MTAFILSMAVQFVNNIFLRFRSLHGLARLCYEWATAWTHMAEHDDEYPDRLFSLSEANRLIPCLEEHLSAVKKGKAVLVHTKDEIKKASKNAQFGGGSFMAPHYISALERINDNLQKIQELGVLVKDVEMGLCDFPHLHEGRVVYLCWKLGEPEVGWWHEVHTGYTSRQPLGGNQ